MPRGDRSQSACPIDRSLTVVGDRWTLAILRDAVYGARRFKEFRESLGIARNILTDRLRELVDEGIFDIAPASDGSRFNEYVLTEKGRDLATVLSALRQWGQRHLFDEGDEMTVAVDRRTGRPPAPLQLLSEEGRVLHSDDLMVTKTVYHAAEGAVPAGR